MERLTAADLSMVWPEDFRWPQDIGAVADRETCPDVQVFAGGVRASLDTLARSVLAPTA
jgi:hypothetical protein